MKLNTLFITFYKIANLLPGYLNKQSNIFNKEYNSVLNYNLTENESNIIRNISGFYGLIGSRNGDKKCNLFNTDRYIQGIFFDNGTINYCSHFVKTDKCNSIYPLSCESNTGLIHFNNKTYVIQENDNPYEIKVDFTKKKIKTINKLILKDTDEISPYPKITENNIMHTISYDRCPGRINYFKYDNEFNLIQKKKIITNYEPMINDFIVHENKIIFTETPLTVNYKLLKDNKLPLMINNKNNNYIVIYDSFLDKTYYIKANEHFMILHYISSYEDQDNIYIYGIFYDESKFNSLFLSNIKDNYDRMNKNILNIYAKYGKLRQLIINKNTDNILIVKNKFYESKNLNFIIQNKKYYIFSNINQIIINKKDVDNNNDLFNNSVMIYDLSNNLNIIGEPIILDEHNIIISIVKKENNKNYIFILNIDNMKNILIPIDANINIMEGFNSIFIEKH